MEFRSGEAMMIFDGSLRVRAWNAAAEALTGIPASEAVGRYCWEVLGADDERGAAVCHRGCSYARLAAEGWPVPTRRFWVRTARGKRRLGVATVAVRGWEGPLYLHLLRNGEEVEANGPRSAAGPALTGRQQQILELLAGGMPAKVIAVELGLSETTVRNHIRGILVRLEAHSQLEAVARARRLGLLAA